MAKEIALTAEVARFVTRTQPRRIPRNVMHLGKRSLLDGLGHTTSKGDWGDPSTPS